jgi:hypothetical protein
VRNILGKLVKYVLRRKLIRTLSGYSGNQKFMKTPVQCTVSGALTKACVELSFLNYETEALTLWRMRQSSKRMWLGVRDQLQSNNRVIRRSEKSDDRKSRKLKIG